MHTQCSIPDCKRFATRRGWCNRHYLRWYVHGNPMSGRPQRERLRGTPLERFWSCVNKTDTCWLWTGRILEGYAKLWFDRRDHSAHRLSYEWFIGPVPDGLELDHLCRVPHCINPSHLEAVTHRLNVLRGESPTAVNARKTHCPAGHLYDLSNTIYWGAGRYCRACRA
jgi:hypothetical protein